MSEVCQKKKKTPPSASKAGANSQPVTAPNQKKRIAWNRRLDIDKALQLKIAGASYADIAKTQGVCKQAVHQAISHFLPSNDTQHYIKHRADILAEIQRQIIYSIDADDIKKAPMGSRILAAAQLYDKERLERGQSTTNISVATGVSKEILEEIKQAIVQRSTVDITPPVTNN